MSPLRCAQPGSNTPASVASGTVATRRTPRSPAVHAVVVAGGAGTRFWPLSREARPKPLLQIGSERTLLGETLARARRLTSEDKVWLVCGASHAAEMKRVSGLRPNRVLVEPRMRNTAAATALAAHRIAKLDPDAVMVFLAADHQIPDGTAFARAIRKAVKAAAEADVLVTVGVKPTRAETGYGYIRLGDAAARRHPGLRTVDQFVEKPDPARAKRYLRHGGYLWNAGIFVWRAATILAELARHAPELAKPLAPLGKSNVRNLRSTVEKVYRRVPAEPIDTAVLERSDRVWCLPVDFHWSDVGTFKSLAEEVGVTETVTKVIQGEAWVCDSQGSLVSAKDRPVVLLGVSNLVVVDAGDAILVADLDRSADVKDIVAMLRNNRRGELV